MSEQGVIYPLYRARSLWNVPASFTSLVGREREIAAIVDIMRRPDVRLLTLPGVGGVGKTRLSIQVAREMRAFFSDGVCFVALSALHDPEQVIAAIAETLGIQHLAHLPVFEQVTYFLSERHMLLILDNFEQVMVAAPLLEELLSACPALKLLVTSREVLRLQAEREFSVFPLALPPHPEQLKSEEIAAYPAIALFVQRAQAVLPDFQLTAANVQAIARLCIRLDGLPLAIELAAARVKLLPPEALLKRLAQGFQVLGGGARTLPERQRTLFNTIKWSYDLLNAGEKWLFRRLSLFAGGWTVQAAEAVCAGREDIVVLDGLASLLDKSLLSRVEQAGEEPRLSMLMAVQNFGQDCLRECGEMEEARRAHAAYYFSLANEAYPHLSSSAQLAWLARLEQEHENLRAALEWLVGAGEAEQALRLCGALEPFWFRRGYWTEGRGWLRIALDLPAEQAQTATRAKALHDVAELIRLQGDDAEARPLLEESIALYRQLGDEDGLIRALSTLATTVEEQGDLATAYGIVEEAVARAEQQQYRWGLANALRVQGHILWLRNKPQQALAITEKSLLIARGLDDLSLTAFVLNNLAYMDWQQKNFARAETLARENMLLARKIDDRRLLESTLETLGSIALDQGDPEQAKAHFVESFALAQQLGQKSYLSYCLTLLARVAAEQNQFRQAARLYGVAARELVMERVLNESERAEYERHVATVRLRLGEQKFAAAWAEGQTLTVEQAFAQAVAASEPRPEVAPALLQPLPAIPPATKPAYPDDLTAREVEVLRLLARGWSDAQIADYLVISRRTVHRHTSSIYSKIGVTSRSAATRYALEKHLA